MDDLCLDDFSAGVGAGGSLGQEGGQEVETERVHHIFLFLWGFLFFSASPFFSLSFFWELAFRREGQEKEISTGQGEWLLKSERER